ncbi:MAG TPA: helix-turn-helix domain-containing protein, partial [Bordetella sp.]|nr:helix-turn-helix domain-containing protein [Bordetella sp.]
ATHQPLQDMIAQRRFRQDLYYRINTLRLEVPALRDRPEDVAPLMQALVARCLRRLDSPFEAAGLIAPWLPRLQCYAWPGNVRELENISERMAVFLLQYQQPADVDHDALRHDCPELYEAAHAGDTAGELSLRARALHALQVCGGNRQEAARRLGISRSTLWRWANAPQD